VTRYRIVPEGSELHAEARSSLHAIHVRTSRLGGFMEATMNGSGRRLEVAPAGSLELEVEDLKSGNFLYDREIERQLEVRKYPRIRGVVRAVEPLGKNGRYRVQGELTLHGVKRPVEGEVTVRVVDASTLEIAGEKVFDVRDFGLDPPRILMLKVYPDVRVRARVIARCED
jgi:polyisoprenoid-binding protein YceI